jgi:hypothetical protein
MVKVWTAMAYEQKEKRLDEIFGRLDRSETPMDNLAVEAKKAARLIMSMQATLCADKQEVASVFSVMENQKEALGLKPKAE